MRSCRPPSHSPSSAPSVAPSGEWRRIIHNTWHNHLTVLVHSYRTLPLVVHVRLVRLARSPTPTIRPRSAPGYCVHCFGAGDEKASFLTWAEIEETDEINGGGPPIFRSSVSRASAVFGPFDCPTNKSAADCDTAKGAEDPRLTYNPEDQLYYLVYNADGVARETINIATTQDPTRRDGWVRHGEVFPTVGLRGYKSGAIVLRAAPSEHFLLWGCDKEVRITPSIGRDLLRWDYNSSKVLLSTRPSSFWDSGFVEAAMPPLPLSVRLKALKDINRTETVSTFITHTHTHTSCCNYSAPHITCTPTLTTHSHSFTHTHTYSYILPFPSSRRETCSSSTTPSAAGTARRGTCRGGWCSREQTPLSYYSVRPRRRCRTRTPGSGAMCLRGPAMWHWFPTSAAVTRSPANPTPSAFTLVARTPWLARPPLPSLVLSVRFYDSPHISLFFSPVGILACVNERRGWRLLGT